MEPVECGRVREESDGGAGLRWDEGRICVRAHEHHGAIQAELQEAAAFVGGVHGIEGGDGGGRGGGVSWERSGSGSEVKVGGSDAEQHRFRSVDGGEWGSLGERPSPAGFGQERCAVGMSFEAAAK